MRTVGSSHGPSEVSYLLERVNGLKPSPEKVRSNGWFREDIKDLVLEVAEYLRVSLDVPSLDQELIARSRIDHETLNQAVRLFENPSVHLPDLEVMENELSWHERLARLRGLVDSLQQSSELEEVEVGLRLSLIGDTAFERLLMALSADDPIRFAIRNLVTTKLALLSDADAMDYWARLRREVDPESEEHLRPVPEIAPNEFFDLGDAKSVRPHIADYLVRVRPLLIRAGRLAGQTRWPAGQARVAVVLSWTSKPSTTAWSARQRIAIRSLSRLAVLWTGEGAELASALGVASDGFFIQGRGQQEADRSRAPRGSPPPDPNDDILSELEKLLRIAGRERAKPELPTERALRAFKLGLEVAVADVGKTMRKRNELGLQRDLCRFLVERDIRALGTTFGQSQLDLRADDEIGSVLIEAKKVVKVPSESDVNRWLTQLGSYMDQDHRALRGVLALFNFTNVPIIAPPTPLRLKYLIVAINLCSDSPSKRRASIELIEGQDRNLVDVVSIGEPTSQPKRKRAAQSARRK